MTIYSHSRLSTFENCQYKFKLKYLDKVETEIEKTIEAFLGTLVHETLEKLYKDLKFEKLNSLEELLEWFNSEWSKRWNNEIIIVRKEYTPENYRKMGEHFLKEYYEKYKPFNHTKTIDLEKHIIISLDKHGNFKLQGYIDRLAYAGDGVYEIHDYKTNSNLPIDDYLHSDRQLALYAIAVKQYFQDTKDVKLIWHFLAFNKEMQIQKTDEQLEKLKQDTIELIKKIESTTEFKTKVSRLCDWCEFKPICPEWSHLYQIKDSSLTNFLGDSGVQMVNQYADLYTKKKHAETELEQVKEKLVEYANNKKVSAVFGSDHKVRIQTYENFKAPGWNEKERDILENLLKQFGVWDKVSTLDSFALRDALKAKQLPEEIISEIEKFIKKEKTIKITISQIDKRE